MKSATLKTIEQNDNVSLYSVCFDDSDLSEFEKFVAEFKDNAELNNEYKVIIYALTKIMSDGVLERLFRPEGKMNDRVCALSVNNRRLRLYCLRISDKILILGNGGEKTTRTYQEDSDLLGYVLTLQEFDKILKQAEKNCDIVIERNVITNIENITFTL